MRWGCQGQDRGGRKWQKELQAGAQSLGLAIDKWVASPWVSISPTVK